MADKKTNIQKMTFHLKMIQTIASAIGEGAITPKYGADRINDEVLTAHSELTGVEHVESERQSADSK